MLWVFACPFFRLSEYHRTPCSLTNSTPEFPLSAKMPSVPLFLRFPQKFHFCGSPKKKKRASCTILLLLNPPCNNNGAGTQFFSDLFFYYIFILVFIEVYFISLGYQSRSTLRGNFGFLLTVFMIRFIVLNHYSPSIMAKAKIPAMIIPMNTYCLAVNFSFRKTRERSKATTQTQEIMGAAMAPFPPLKAYT